MNAGDEKLITEMLDALKQALPTFKPFVTARADIALTKALNAISNAERALTYPAQQ